MPSGQGEIRRDTGGLCVGGSDGSVWEVAVGIKRNDANIEEREWLQVEAERSYDVELTGKYTGKWVQCVGMGGSSGDKEE